MVNPEQDTDAQHAQRNAESDGSPRLETDERATGDGQPVKWRRRIIAAGVATPIVATLYSRSAFAQENVSANMSCSASTVGTSSQEDCGGSGFSADFWAQNTDLFHPDYRADYGFDYMFDLKNVFGPLALGTVVAGAKPMEAFTNAVMMANFSIDSENTDEAERQEAANNIATEAEFLGRQAVAALQNGATAVPYDYTHEQVLALVASTFNDAVNYGDVDRMGMVARNLESLNNQGDNGTVSWEQVLIQRTYGA